MTVEEASAEDCPNGHGPMLLFRSTPEDDRDDFLECPECGYNEDIPGQRTAEE